MGKTIHLNDYPFTVAGIASPGFFGVEVGFSPDVWIPMTMQAQVSSDRLRMRNAFWVKIMARLKPGVSEPQARVATDVLCRQINQEAPGLSPALRGFLLNQHIQLDPASRGVSSLKTRFRNPLLILMGAVGLVLLIACANVANLLLARSAARRREIAVRLALGARRAHVIRQSFTVSVLLSLSGALLGLLFALWITDLLLGFLPAVDFTLELRPDVRVLGITLGLSVLTSLLIGLVPAFQAARPDLTSALKDKNPAAGKGGRRLELSKMLVVSQVALSLVLLIGAGLFVHTLQNLKDVDLGFNADNVLLVSMNPGLNGYNENQVEDFYMQLLDRVRALPGVQEASVADMPLLDGAWLDGISVEGYQPLSGQDMNTSAKRIEPKFFDTMGIALRTGRDFDARDRPDAPGVAIVNETFAHDFFGQENPLGRRIGIGDEQPDREIIGVINDTKYQDVKENVPRTVYVPFAQSVSQSAERTLHVKTAGDPERFIPVIRREVQAIDKNLPVYNVRTFPELVAERLSQERLVATLSTLFGFFALGLASIGLYGVMAYSVARRTHEIGIRMALGARTWDVLALVLGQGMVLTLIGSGIGLAIAFAVTHLLTGLLYGVSPVDPMTFAGITVLLSVVALLACWLPARRATKVDPMAVLRCE